MANGGGWCLARPLREVQEQRVKVYELEERISRALDELSFFIPTMPNATHISRVQRAMAILRGEEVSNG